jgi:anti-anti-sigma factor
VTLFHLTFLDSTGLGLIARLAASEHRSGRRLRVDGASRLTRDLLEVAGLCQVLDLRPGPTTLGRALS